MSFRSISMSLRAPLYIIASLFYVIASPFLRHCEPKAKQSHRCSRLSTMIVLVLRPEIASSLALLAMTDK